MKRCTARYTCGEAFERKLASIFAVRISAYNTVGGLESVTVPWLFGNGENFCIHTI